MVPIIENYRAIVARMETARKQAIAPAPATSLIAVSKFHSAGTIRTLLEAGHRDFGESRVQEAAAKWPALKAEFPDVRLHMIGPLQSNKAAEVVALFDVIHSLDRPKLAAALAAALEKSDRRPSIFIQVNTGEEPQKGGILPMEAPAFIAAAKNVFPGLIKGLMCIPPFDEAPAPHFALLKTLATEARLAGLSMGMSDDFDTAIAFGATHVRIGTAIFGPRPAL